MAVSMLDAGAAKDVAAGGAGRAVGNVVASSGATCGCQGAFPEVTLPAIGTIGAPTAKSSPAAPRGRLLGVRAVAVGCPPGSRREGYRIGRWERLAMTIVVAVALVVAAVALLRPAAPATREVTVLPGDTMTSLVLREVPDLEVGRAAELVEELNGLSGSTVSPGMRLAVPAGR